MTYVKVTGTEEFKEFARKCKAAGSEGKGLLNEIRRALKDGADPVVKDAQARVRALSSQGGGGAARAARTAYALSKRKSGISERAKMKVHASTGLRSSAARATKAQITATGNTARARIRVDSSLMPPTQRKLPRHMNRGSWRHPVMGNRKNWVEQRVSPDGWFDKAMKEGGPKVREDAFDTVRAFLDRF